MNLLLDEPEAVRQTAQKMEEASSDENLKLRVAALGELWVSARMRFRDAAPGELLRTWRSIVKQAVDGEIERCQKKIDEIEAIAVEERSEHQIANLSYYSSYVAAVNNSLEIQWEKEIPRLEGELM